MRKEKIYEVLEKDIMKLDVEEKDKNVLLRNIMKLKEERMNIMITGATGCGKSSTINALFDTEVAKVGVGADPETMRIEKYELDNLVLWDTPGLGDGKAADEKHAKNIIRKLKEVDADGNALIDLVLVILDGGTRDMGTSYELINNVIIKNLGDKKEGRILVAINQADMAMKGRNWDYEKNMPNKELEAFLDEKVTSVKNRVYEATGVKIDPIYYSAGYKEEGVEQTKPYNLSKLLYYIVKSTPEKKRVIIADNINEAPDLWKGNDRRENYGRQTVETLQTSIADTVFEGTGLLDIGKKVVKGVFSVGKAIVSGIGRIFRGLFG